MKAQIFKRILLALAVLALCGLLIMWLWNALAPSIFGLVSINFWQALGLFVLCRILFGCFNGGWLFAASHRFYRNPIREKWERMSPEEREKFIRHRHWDHRFRRFDQDYCKNEESEKND
ncbi:MAG: hypothetical protein FWF52_03020 [Candidatus Azobacteroides sp.]|nr:hypothetical protein [Candidatus Azobacteroides sp.]